MIYCDHNMLETIADQLRYDYFQNRFFTYRDQWVRQSYYEAIRKIKERNS